MPLPNFLIVGAAKSGTTSLSHYLNQHPQVFIPPDNKEPNFFIMEGRKLPPFEGPADAKTLYEKIYRFSITNLEDYQSLFQAAHSAIAIGEASIPYLYFPQAPKRIKHYVPNVKIVAILRHPVDRLYSHYLMVREKYLLEPLELFNALEQEEKRIRNNWGWDWHYANLGMYATQLQRYLQRFDRDQIHVILYEDFRLDPIDTIQGIYRHIGVDETFIPDTSKRSKVSYKSRSLALNRVLNGSNPVRERLKKQLPKSVYKRAIARANRWNSKPVPPLPAKVRANLTEQFREEIFHLQDLIHRDLSHWL